ncbi:uncharacterized protein LOC132548986 [Ylistrum balloti]|uniref:uncharacterized protein LOC132548986 n=1 Tax=Ylistrum balloti TaxID=509963 RepID=UPI00290592C2|nr:uncharacterized protein LOC132548986 [Ylistrum balloti]
MVPLLLLPLLVSGVVSKSTSSSTLFSRYSADHHHLTKSEFSHIFLSFDTNTNHQVTISEFEHGWTQQHLRDSTESGYFFTVADVDGDLRITQDDMNYLFIVMDTSADDSLSPSEFSIGWHNLFEAGGDDDD